MPELTCNWPECVKTVKSRGLCGAHYQRLYSSNAETRQEAETYADPPMRPKGRTTTTEDTAPRAASTAEATENAGAAAPRPAGEPDSDQFARWREHALNDLICTTVAVCRQLGMTVLPRNDGRMLLNPASGKAVELTDEGLAYAVEIRRAGAGPLNVDWKDEGG